MPGLALLALLAVAAAAAGTPRPDFEAAGEDASTREDANSPGADAATPEADATLLEAASDGGTLEDSPVDAGVADADHADGVDSSPSCPPESVAPGSAYWAAALGESLSFPPQDFYDPYGIVVDPEGNVVVRAASPRCA